MKTKNLFLSAIAVLFMTLGLYAQNAENPWAISVGIDLISLQGENINTGTRGDILYYDAAGKIAKLNIGAAGSVLKTDGTDVSWGGIGGAPTV